MSSEAEQMARVLRTPGVGALWGPPPFEEAADLIEKQAAEIAEGVEAMKRVCETLEWTDTQLTEARATITRLHEAMAESVRRADSAADCLYPASVQEVVEPLRAAMPVAVDPLVAMMKRAGLTEEQANSLKAQMRAEDYMMLHTGKVVAQSDDRGGVA